MKNTYDVHWERLHFFFNVSHYEDFTRAAKALFISPSAISRSISQLENDLGYPLFKRQGRKITLTQQGQKLQQALLVLQKQQEQVHYNILNTWGETHGRITLKIHPVLTQGWIQNIIASFQRTHPSVTFCCRPFFSTEPENIDFHIGITDTPPKKETLSAFSFFVPLFLYGPPSFFSGKGEQKYVRLPYYLILRAPIFENFAYEMLTHLKEEGISFKKILYLEVANDVRTLVQSGEAAGYFPSFFMTKGTPIHPSKDTLTPPGFFVWGLKREARSPQAAVFGHFLKDQSPF